MKVKPLYKKIIDEIITDIYSGKLRAGDRVPSERELAQQYLVSQMTSKNALNELAEKNYIIRTKGKGSFVNIAEVLIELGYIDGQTVGKFPQKKVIGLILSMMKTKIDQELLDHIEFYSNKMGYNLILKISRELQMNETASIRELMLIGAEGLIIFPTENELYNGEILKLTVNDFPLVFVDRYLQGINACSITTNNYQITKDAILDMKNRGAKSIVLISPDSKNSVTNDRLAGFNSAFSEHINEVSQSYKLMIDLNVKEQGEKEEIIRSFIFNNKNIDGFFCVNHELAKLLLRVMEKHFPNMLHSHLLYAFDAYDLPYFTYIQQDTHTISKLAVENLIDLIHQKGSKNQIAIPAEIKYK